MQRTSSSPANRRCDWSAPCPRKKTPSQPLPCRFQHHLCSALRRTTLLFSQLSYNIRTEESCSKRWRRTSGINTRSDIPKNFSRTHWKKGTTPESPSNQPLSSLTEHQVLPIGGLGEIGMNCMLVGVYNRFILIDAGLMFPDFADVGMQKILPDCAFIHQWKDKIEAVVITHGHEDHIGAIPWVFPALDPDTPIYTTAFVHHLLRFRLKQYNLWDADRFRTFEMNAPFQLGPFECEALRVTHSIPDCCGLILRSSHGTILHTGDWKIDEDPVDGRLFDRATFEKLSKEEVTLMMSDSTNVLTPGRGLSESVVRQSLIDHVSDYKGSGRIIATQFSSNLHRMGSLKAAADAVGRKLCFVGLSLGSYLSAAVQSGDAPFHPKDVIDGAELDDIDPSEVLVITTGSQAEPQSALNMASMNGSSKLRLAADDYLLYSAKIIPGNEKRVVQMMNRISRMGSKIVMDRNAKLHASGHGYKDELAEVIKLVKPQHFLPIHGESVFLHSHAELAQELGIKSTTVIHDGEMLGIKPLRSRRTVSSGSLQLLGDVRLTQYFNDGHKGTGTFEEMAIRERRRMGVHGVLIVSVDVTRPPRIAELIHNDTAHEQTGLKARIKLTSRGIWTDKGKLIRQLFKLAQTVIARCPIDSSCAAIDRAISHELRRACRKFNVITPEVIVVVHEYDPRTAAALSAATERATADRPKKTKEEIKDDVEAEPKPTLTASTKSRGRKPRSTTPKLEEETEAEVTVPSIEESIVESPNGTVEEAAIPNDPSEDPNRTGVASNTSKSETATKRQTFKSSTASSGGRRRRGRPSKIKDDDEVFGDARPIPEGLLEKRRRANPRERPVSGVDVEYG